MSKNKTPQGPPLLGELPALEQRKYTDILIEEMRSQNKAVIETLQSVEQRLDKKIDGMETRLTQRIETVEMAIRATRGDLKEVEKNLSDKIDSIGDTIVQHDTDITFLKTAAAKF